MTFEFKPGVRENTHVLVALAGSSGSGKTFSALRLATGLAGPNGKIAVLDTEAGRALHYADQFNFMHGDLMPPFTPQRLLDAISAAEAQGFAAIVIDSMSLEWSGEGGVLDMQEAELHRMAGDDWKKREACKMAAWIKPKTAHKRLIQKLLQCRSHLIFCLRAEEKVKMERDGNGKMVIVPLGWQPICEKNFMFEMTVSFVLTADRPGIPQAIKLQNQHAAMFPSGQPITEACGNALAAWAAGGVAKKDATIDARALYEIAENEARKGLAAIKAWWRDQPAETKAALDPFKAELVEIGKRVDSGEIVDDPTPHDEDGVVAEPEPEPAAAEPWRTDAWPVTGAPKPTPAGVLAWARDVGAHVQKAPTLDALKEFLDRNTAHLKWFRDRYGEPSDALQEIIDNKLAELSP